MPLIYIVNAWWKNSLEIQSEHAMNLVILHDVHRLETLIDNEFSIRINQGRGNAKKKPGPVKYDKFKTVQIQMNRTEETALYNYLKEN